MVTGNPEMQPNYFRPKKRLKWVSFDIGIILLLCTTCLYFCFIAINGNHGVKKKTKLEFEAIELRKQLEDFKQIASDMEGKVKKLQGKDLDLDLLDEQARQNLGLIRTGEVIIIR